MGVKEASRKEGMGKREKKRFKTILNQIFDIDLYEFTVGRLSIQCLTFVFRGVQGTEMEMTGKKVQAGGMAKYPFSYNP